MPGIYSGWEQAHPDGLIAELNKLGFNHCILIKRIEQHEFVSVDNFEFVEKQWGNLIFINDKIFHQARTILDKIVNEKELQLIHSINHHTNILEQEIVTLRQACEQRLHLIDQLNLACQEKEIAYSALKSCHSSRTKQLYPRKILKKMRTLFQKQKINS